MFFWPSILLNSNIWVRTRFFCKNKNSILKLFFHNFQKIWKRTNSEIYVSSEFLETAVFDPKTPVFASKRAFDLNLFLNFFSQNFCEFKKMGFSKKFLKFKNWTIPKLAKMKSLEKLCLSQGLKMFWIIENCMTSFIDNPILVELLYFWFCSEGKLRSCALQKMNLKLRFEFSAK